jgi:hypothetical protein
MRKVAEDGDGRWMSAVRRVVEKVDEEEEGDWRGGRRRCL